MKESHSFFLPGSLSMFYLSNTVHLVHLHSSSPYLVQNPHWRARAEIQGCLGLSSCLFPWAVHMGLSGSESIWVCRGLPQTRLAFRGPVHEMNRKLAPFLCQELRVSCTLHSEKGLAQRTGIIGKLSAPWSVFL